MLTTPISFPSIIIESHAATPFLVTCGEDSFFSAFDLMNDRSPLRACTLYTREGQYAIACVHPTKKPTWWDKLKQHFTPCAWEMAVELTTPQHYELAALKDKLRCCISQDDDCLTQYYEAHTLIRLIDRCHTFEEIIVTGCLCGFLIADSAEKGTLPELHYNPDEYDAETQNEEDFFLSKCYKGVLSEEHIAHLAKHLFPHS